MSRPACDSYEIVCDEIGPPRRSRQSRLVRLGGLLARVVGLGAGGDAGGVRVISVRERATGAEVFRHIEDIGDDDHDMLGALEADLASMTVSDFEARWVR